MNYDITFCEGGKAFEKTNATATASCYATAPTKTRTKKTIHFNVQTEILKQKIKYEEDTDPIQPRPACPGADGV